MGTSAARKVSANAASLAASQTTSGSGTTVLAGTLKLDAELPSISGRGRPATVPPAEMLANIRAMLEAGRGRVDSPEFMEINGDNGHAKYKRTVEAAALLVGGERNHEVGLKWVTIEGSLGAAAKGKPGDENYKPATPPRFPVVVCYSAFDKDATSDQTR